MRPVRDYHIDLSTATFAIHSVGWFVVSLIASWLAIWLRHVKLNWKERSAQLGPLFNSALFFGHSLARFCNYNLWYYWTRWWFVRWGKFIEGIALEIVGIILATVSEFTSPFRRTETRGDPSRHTYMLMRTSLMTYWKFHLKFVYSLPQNDVADSRALSLFHTPPQLSRKQKSKLKNWNVFMSGQGTTTTNTVQLVPILLGNMLLRY